MAQAVTAPRSRLESRERLLHDRPLRPHVGHEPAAPQAGLEFGQYPQLAQPVDDPLDNLESQLEPRLRVESVRLTRLGN